MKPAYSAFSTLLILLVSYIEVPAQLLPLNQQNVCNEDPGTAAIISGRSISLEEIDKTIAKRLQPLEEKIYQLRKQTLESLISRFVLESEAKRNGTSIDRVVKALMQVDDNVPEARVTDIFQENEAALASIGEDEAKARIRLDLEGQAKLAGLRRGLSELRSKAAVSVCLKPPETPALEITETGPSRGAKDAPVTIIEFSDFQCPYCKQARETLEKVLEANEGKVRVVFKHLPLPMHPRAFPAARASYCAQEQNRFWPFHDRLFDSVDLSDERLVGIASETGLDLNAFLTCLNSDASQLTVLRDIQEARKAGFSGTPTFLVNGTVLRGAAGLAEFQRLIDAELMKERRNR